MFEKIRKMKNQKGFTLVELIVVLVILAILAALLVPALTGYIDKANKEKVIATTRMVVMAAQTEISEKYGLKADGKLTGTKAFGVEGATGADPLSKTGTTVSTTEANADGIKINDIALLAEVAKEVKKDDTTTDVEFVNGVTKIEVYYNTKGQVTAAVVEQSGFTCTYKASPETGKDKYEVKEKTN